MSTKYAKARDTAGQWRSEYRKVRAENKTLRNVYLAAKNVALVLKDTPQPVAVEDALLYLRDALRNAQFAEEQP